MAFRFIKTTPPIATKSYQFSEGVAKKPPQGIGYAPATVSTLVEEKTAPPAVKIPLTASETTTDIILAEEYLYLHEKAEKLGMKEILSRMEELRKKMLASIPEDMDPKTEVTFAVDGGMVVFSPCGETCEVAKKSELLEYLSQKFDSDVLLSLIRFNMTDLRKVLSEKELEPFLAKKNGSRTIKAIHQDWS